MKKESSMAKIVFDYIFLKQALDIMRFAFSKLFLKSSFGQECYHVLQAFRFAFKNKDEVSIYHLLVFFYLGTGHVSCSQQTVFLSLEILIPKHFSSLNLSVPSVA